MKKVTDSEESREEKRAPHEVFPVGVIERHTAFRCRLDRGSQHLQCAPQQALVERSGAVTVSRPHLLAHPELKRCLPAAVS